MSDFKAKMHKIPLESLQCSPDPIADLRGLLLMEGREGAGNWKGGERKARGKRKEG